MNQEERQVFPQINSNRQGAGFARASHGSLSHGLESLFRAQPQQLIPRGEPWVPLELEAGFSQDVERAIEVGVNLVPQRRCTGLDKTVYEREKVSLAQAFNTLMLADKAYAGVFDEGAALLRPIKRGERLWREQP